VRFTVNKLAIHRCTAEKHDVITVRDGSVRSAPVLAKHCSSYHLTSTTSTTLPTIISTGLHPSTLTGHSGHVDSR